MKRGKKNSPATEPAIGVIGGSGLYQMEGIDGLREIRLKTPFGAPSDAFLDGQLGSRRVVFLPRHGRGHLLQPSEINFRANIWGMKKLGVQRILSVSAVGSMREEIVPGDFVIIDQFFDRTRGRISTFFGNGVVGHVLFADPVCAGLRATLLKTGKSQKLRIHDGGTYICMEGPQFSTRAESRIYRRWGVDVIGMTNLQEAKLAREAEICYATIAMATDYDCWHESHEDVTVEAVIAVMNANVGKVKDLLRRTIPTLSPECNCGCQNSLKNAIMTQREKVPAKRIQELEPILGKYFS